MLDIAEIPRRPDAGDVRLRPRRRLVCSHPRAEAHRPADPAGGALHRARPAHPSPAAVTLAEDAAAQADALAEQGDERELSQLRAQWDEELEAAARVAGLPRAGGRLPRDRRSSASGRRSSCCGAGSRTRARPCRGSALLSLEKLSRDHPGVVNDVRPLLHELVDARRQRGGAPARGRRAEERLARPDTIRSSPRSAPTTSSRASCATRRRRSRSCCVARRRSREPARRSVQRSRAGRTTGRSRRGASAQARSWRGRPSSSARPLPTPGPSKSSTCGSIDIPCLSVVARRVGVRPEVQLPASPIGYVGVELGRREIGMAEHFLNAAEVGAALEQVRRERVAQEVRVDAARVEARPSRRACAGSGTRRRG